MEKLLHDSWHESATKFPFLNNLLIKNEALSDFDMSFLNNWTNKKMCGRYCKADKQARAMAVLYCNKLGQKTYGELASILGLLGLKKTNTENEIKANYV